MKKIYLLSSALLLSMVATAQIQERTNKKIIGRHQISFTKRDNPSRTIQNPDTTGLVNYSDFLPEFLPAGSGGLYYNEWDYNAGYGGYYFGNNRGGWNVWAQGYNNVNNTPVKIIGAIVWFGKKESDLTTNSGSVVTIGVYPMSSNKACNTDGTGVYNGTTQNAIGPNTITPIISGTIPFSAIDTINRNSNYVAFSNPPTYTGDFAISIDTRTLVAGDTVGILTDDWSTNDGQNLDYNYVLSNASGGRWVVVDNWGSDETAPVLGTGQFDLDIAIFAVISDATGVNEFFNGMKLTTYPNPTVDEATIEYTLEKASNNVRLVLYDQKAGKVVDKEFNIQSAGTYKVDIETSNLAAGTYFYQLRANGREFTKRLIVTK